MKKIMFNDKYGLTRAVLEGYKTQTRRLVPEKYYELLESAGKPVLIIPLECVPENVNLEEFAQAFASYKAQMVIVSHIEKMQVSNPLDNIVRKLARYLVGEEIAIAKPYAKIKVHETLRLQQKLNRSYLISTFKDSAGWNNKMFVKSEYMPNRIKITNISAERLQDISDEDCMKEGIMEGEFMNTWDRFYYDEWGDIANHITFKTPREAYASLINKINGKDTWEKNPWVLVYDFELVK